MTNKFFSDDLSDLLGGEAAPAAPAQPQGEGWDRIRSYADQAPAAKAFEIPCFKCKGSGSFIGYTGRRVGPCFTCKGKGTLERKTAPAQLERAKERRLEAKEAVRQEAKPQIAWLHGKLAQSGLPEGYADILRNCLEALQAGRVLSEGRQGVVDRGMARDATYAAKRQEKAQERAQAAPAVDASKIVEAFQRAREAGLTDIKLRFEGVTIKPAKFDPTGNTLLVKAGVTNIGKIEAGKFIAFRACSPGQQARVVTICADPTAAAQAYGFATSSCCVCGRGLTNKESVETGIGPICSGRLGWTPGRLKVMAPVF